MNWKHLIYLTIISAFQSGDRVKLLHAVQSARKILSREKNPPIDKMINAGLVPLLVQLLDIQTDDEYVMSVILLCFWL